MGLTAEDVDKAFADGDNADVRRTVRASRNLGVSRAFWKEAPSSTHFLRGVRVGVDVTSKEVRLRRFAGYGETDFA
jgi:hypothetical protein